MNCDLNKEKELLESVKADKQNFDKLYKYFLNDVYRFSYSIVGNKPDAEDITSQVFMELYKKIDSFQWQEKSLKSWLFLTARNLAYKKFRDLKTEVIENENEIVDECEISFVDEILNLELVEQVKQEIENLSTVEKQIINLRIWEGMQFSEIAEIQNITENAAKKRFYRTIEKIRKVLDSKGIKSLIALPILFTAIRQSGETHAYLAPNSLENINFNNKNIMEPIIQNKSNKVAAFLTSKVGIASIITLTAVIAVAGGVIAYRASNKSNENKNASQVTPIPTSTITPTSTAITTSTPTPDNDDWKTFVNSTNKFSFKYPKDWTVKEETFICPSRDQNATDAMCHTINFTADNKAVMRLSYTSKTEGNGLLEDAIDNGNIGSFPEVEKADINVLAGKVSRREMTVPDGKANYYKEVKELDSDLNLIFKLLTGQEENLKLSDKILESFALIKPAPSSTLTKTPTPTPFFAGQTYSYVEAASPHVGPRENKTFSFIAPTRWKVTKSVNAANCNNYIAKSEKSTLTIRMLCEGYAATGFSLPADYQIVMKREADGDDGSDSYIFRYYDSEAKLYKYSMVRVEHNKPIQQSDMPHPEIDFGDSKQEFGVGALIILDSLDIGDLTDADNIIKSITLR